MNFKRGIENENIGHQAEEEKLKEKEKKRRNIKTIIGLTSFAALTAALQFFGPKIEQSYKATEPVRQEAEALGIKPPLREEQSAPEKKPEKKIEDMDYNEFMDKIDKVEGINKLAELYVEVRGKYFYYPGGGKELLSVTADNCVLDKILDKIDKKPSLAKEAVEALIRNGMDSTSKEVQIIESYVKE